MRKLLYVSLLPLLWLLALPAQATSKCTDAVYGTSHTLSCTYLTKTVSTGRGSVRLVQYQLPDGTPPAGGWPVVLMYQPSGFPTFWTAPDYTPAGAYHQVRTIEELLNRGYAVVAPPTNPFQFWMTNIPGMDTYINYSTTEDWPFLNNVLNGIAAGQYGPINAGKMFASGMSSGGYNVSRMAVSFQGRFRALAVQSASYANCLGPSCTIPAVLPYNHPPTLFLHGAQDYTVQVSTMYAYRDRLVQQGRTVRTVVAPDLGHEYLPEAPEEIADWFDTYR